MNTILLVLLIVLIVLVAVVGYFIIQKIKPAEKKDDQSLLMLQNQINDMAKILHDRLDSSHKSLTTQFSSSTKIITDVTEKLAKLEETNKQVLGFSEQLQSLEDILKNPKQRGILGEYYLETLLKNTLPPGSFETQYKLGKDDDGKDLIPDAVVFVKDKIIPVDSKFSLENYNRISETRDPVEKTRLEKLFVTDLKNRIVETSKYILPEKGTMDFAFMFIPHEAIYYDLLINKVGAVNEETENLIQRAAHKYHVIIVSPTSFLAYLQTVLQGLKALQIEEQALEIRKHLENLQRHVIAYDDKMKKLGTHLSSAVGSYEDSYKQFNMINKDIGKVTGNKTDIEVLSIDRPKVE